jgi:hypothetical protein
MNYPHRTEKGLMVPARAEHEDGTIGDGVMEILPGHPDYESYLAIVERIEEEEKGE